MDKLRISQVPSNATFDLRHRVLRPNQPPESSVYPLDDHPDSFHLGVFDKQRLICVGSFFREGDPKIESKKPYRLRGMATDPDFRNLKAGTRLLDTAIEILHRRECDLLWCNARTTAADYYKKVGFEQMGEVFDIDGIGPHKVMFKILIEGP